MRIAIIRKRQSISICRQEKFEIQNTAKVFVMTCLSHASTGCLRKATFIVHSTGNLMCILLAQPLMALNIHTVQIVSKVMISFKVVFPSHGMIFKLDIDKNIYFDVYQQ